MKEKITKPKGGKEKGAKKDSPLALGEHPEYLSPTERENSRLLVLSDQPSLQTICPSQPPSQSETNLVAENAEGIISGHALGEAHPASTVDARVISNVNAHS